MSKSRKKKSVVTQQTVRTVMLPANRSQFVRCMRGEPRRGHYGELLPGPIIKRLVFPPGVPVRLTDAEYACVAPDIGTILVESQIAENYDPQLGSPNNSEQRGE